MAVNANDLRKGMAIRHGSDVVIVEEVTHRTPGNLRAFVQATLRSVNTSKSSVQRFGSTEKVEEVMVMRRKLEFSYKDQTGFNFMDTNTYDNFTLQEELIGDAKNYLVENLPLEVIFVEEKAVSVELPSSVNLRVTESPEGIKGDSANNVMKIAVVETGMQVQVPLFIKEGEIIKVDTRTGSYMSRA